ncbi:SprB repeat-containing protein, partial [Psychroserpens sp. XS_ASV72]|uniref:SprB repeat-containing protein n=1 Tax=Psychroserpens sp. XS_ASV72 TaxID=3241293 RepID=UPI003514B153
MKTILQKSQIHKVLLGLAFVSSISVFAQVQQTFTPRFNQTVKGDFTMIANNMLSRNATSNYNGSDGNHDFSDNVYVDIDGNTGIGASTFNSSSATFTNPEPGLSCLSIKKAYLYWAAADKEPSSSVAENQPNWNYNDVKLMLPGETNYTTYTADQVIFRGKDTHFSNDPYICVKDITSNVLGVSNPYGRYQVANVEAKTGSLTAHPSGNTGTSGGWQIVFIYESPLMPSKNISIFDGYAHVTSSVNDFDINFNGFQTIPIGPVNTKIMIGSLEGDQDLSGDRLQIRNVVGNFVDISAPQRSSSNFFNSRITVGNSNFTNRIPASLNTLGFDAAVFDLDNGGIFNTVIGNNQTSATLRLTSNQETYGLYLLGLSVDVWAPDLNPIEMTLNSGMNPADPGNNLGFSFEILNNGNDNAVNLQVTTTLPPQVEFTGADTLPVGVTYNYNSTTGELTFYVADGLVNVGSPQLDIDFDIMVKDECYFLEDSCDLSFDIQFEATYNGVLNPNPQSTLSSASLDDCQVGIQDPNSITVNQPAEAVWATSVNELDVSIDCNDQAALDAAQALEPETNKCDFTYTKVSGPFVEDTNFPNTGTYTNTWTFTDACGRTSAEYVQVITVGQPSSPIDIAFSQNNVLCNGESTGSINVTVSGGIPPYNYSWTGPDAFTSNSEDLNDLAAGTYSLTVTDSNLCLVASETLDVTITEPELQACEIQVEGCPPPVDVTCADSDQGATVEWTPPSFSYECCTSLNGDEYSFFMEFDLPENTFSDSCWDFNYVQRVGTDNLRLFQSTGVGSRFQDSYFITPTQYFDTENGTPINIELIEVSATVNWTLEVIDPSDDSVVYTGNLNDITTNGLYTITIPNTVPSGSYKLKLNFDSSDANGGDSIEIDRLYYDATLLDANCAGGINFVVTSTHNPGDLFTVGEKTVIYTATYTPVSGDPVVLTCEFDVDVVFVNTSEEVANHIDPSCNGASDGSFTVIASGGDAPYSYSLDNIDFSNTSGNFNNLAAGTYTVYVQDANGCTDPTPIEIILSTQDEEAPTITAPDDFTVEGCNYNALPDLAYSTTEQTINIGLLQTAQGGNGSANDDQGIATITYIDSTISTSCPIVIERTFTVTDQCGNSTSDTQTITIEDSTGPELNVPDDIDVECAIETTEPSNTGTATGYDTCGSINITYTDASVPGCGNTETITRTWTATDECGNSTSADQIISVVDTIAPTLTIPEDITVECNRPTDPEPDGNATATDNCSDTVTITFSDSTADSCGNTVIITRTWTATDECGNSTSDDQIITVEDTTPPNLTVPTDATVECTESTDPAATGTATATDT